MQKIKYQYSYFILPYIVNEVKYTEYLRKLLKDNRIDLKRYDKIKDLEIYSFFDERFLDFFSYANDITENDLREAKKDDYYSLAKRLSKKDLTVFDVDLSQNMQGKIGEEEGIFFRIDRTNIITTNVGVSFLVFKTEIDSDNFQDLLNFNYRFRDLSTEIVEYKKYENINIQSDTFKEISDLKNVIEELTGLNLNDLIKNTGIDKFYTFSYLCLDNLVWNENTDFRELQTIFNKYSEVLPAEFNSEFSDINNAIEVIEDLKYSKIGITNLSSNLFSSGLEIHNFTKIPIEYETTYLYIYIYKIFQKVFLDKIGRDIFIKRKYKKALRDLKYFTEKFWGNPITLQDKGVLYINKLKSIFDLNNKYNEIQNKVDIIYKESRVDKYYKYSKGIYYLLVILIIITILNILLFRRKYMKYIYTGIDIIEIDRIAESIKDKRFLEKIFTEKEQALCTRKNEAEFYAGRFAAKEAIFKALSNRMAHKKLDWLDVEILADKNGRPKINFLKGGLKLYENKIDVSISHNKTTSVASAVLSLQ